VAVASGIQDGIPRVRRAAVAPRIVLQVEQVLPRQRATSGARRFGALHV
jgi:hypothetical protein